MTWRPAAGRRQAPRRAKYGAIPSIVDGQRFASRKEARVYQRLRVLEQTGHIRELRCQVRFDLPVNGERVCTYVADFTWIERSGEFIVADVKSTATATIERYRLKRKLFRAVHGFDIQEIA